MAGGGSLGNSMFGITSFGGNGSFIGKIKNDEIEFLQKQVETQLARALVAGEVDEGSTVAFSVKDDELVMKVD